MIFTEEQLSQMAEHVTKASTDAITAIAIETNQTKNLSLYQAMATISAQSILAAVSYLQDLVENNSEVAK